MTILTGGSEMGTFIPADSNAVEVSTTGGSLGSLRNQNFSRAAVMADSSSYAETSAFSAQTDFWVHACIGNESYASGSTEPLVLISGAAVEAFKLSFDRGTNVLTLYYWNGASYTSAGTITIALESTFHDIDLHTVCNSGSGSLTLYVAGTQRISATGLNLSGIASITKVRQNGAGFGPAMSQLVVSTQSTIGYRLPTRYPNGVGSDTGWTGTYTGIDEAVYSDADFINAATNGLVSMFTQTGPALTGYVVKAVIVTARAKRGSTGPANLQLGLRSAGTNYFSASKALDLGYGGFVEVWETDPATGSAWQNTAIDTLQIGVKAVT